MPNLHGKYLIFYLFSVTFHGHNIFLNKFFSDENYKFIKVKFLIKVLITISGTFSLFHYAHFALMSF